MGRACRQITATDKAAIARAVADANAPTHSDPVTCQLPELRDIESARRRVADDHIPGATIARAGQRRARTRGRSTSRPVVRCENDRCGAVSANIARHLASVSKIGEDGARSLLGPAASQRPLGKCARSRLERGQLDGKRRIAHGHSGAGECRAVPLARRLRHDGTGRAAARALESDGAQGLDPRTLARIAAGVGKVPDEPSRRRRC